MTEKQICSYQNPTLSSTEEVENCQFHNSQLHVCDGAPYCIFHLPRSEKIKFNENQINIFMQSLHNQVIRFQRPSRRINLRGIVFPPGVKKLLSQFLRDDCKNVDIDLSNTQHLDDVEINLSRFDATLTLEHGKFEKQLQIINTEFVRSVTISNVDIHGNFDVSKCRFSVESDLTRIISHADIRVTESYFNTARISYIKCNGKFSVSSCVLRRNTSLSNLECEEDSFFNINFEEELTIKSWNVKKSLNCNITGIQSASLIFSIMSIYNTANLVFSGAEKLEFTKNEFGQNTLLDFSNISTIEIAGVHFEGDADIRFSNVQRRANVRNITANCMLSIQGPNNLNAVCEFVEWKTNGEVKFRVEHGSASYYTNCQFLSTNKEVSFRKAKFHESVSFRSSRFAMAPDFTDAQCPSDVVFANTMFEDTRSEFSVARYRVLRKLAELHDNGRDRGRFFALERRSMRHTKEIDSTERVIDWMYDATSQYGENVARPLLVLTVVQTFYALVYALWFGDNAQRCVSVFATICNNLESSASLVLTQMFRPFEILSPRYSANSAAFNLVDKILLGSQSILTIIFFALFLVALRRRFRMN